MPPLRQLPAAQRSRRSATIGSLIGVAGIALAGAAVIAHGMQERRNRVIRPCRQAQRLHGEVAGSRLEILRGGSHMVHHIAPERIVHAIDAVAAESSAWQPQAS